MLKVNFDLLIATLKEAEGGKTQNELVEKNKRKESLALLQSKNSTAEFEELSKIGELIKAKDELIVSTLGKEFNTLYNTAKDIFEKSNLQKDTCPLCDSSDLIFDGNKSLYDVIINKLKDFEEIKQLNLQIKKQWNVFSGKQRIISIGLYLENNKNINLYTEAERLISSESINKEEYNKLVSYLIETDKKVSEEQNKLFEEVENLKAKLPASISETFEKINNVKQLVFKIKQLVEVTEEGKELKKQVVKIKQWQDYLSNLTQQISSAETKLNQTICVDIESNTRNYFSKIINNNNIVPSLTRAVKSQDLDLELETFFNTDNLNATPLLSESYRNALAISIFLASLMRSKHKAKFVVFDDICSSFDAGNQLSLMNLLYNEISTAFNPDGLQIIILSHDGLLRKYFNSQSSQPESKWRSIELQGLAPHGKVLIINNENEQLKTTIINQLNFGNINIATPLMRQYLEYVSLDIIRKLRIPVPFDMALKEDTRTISECLNAIQAHIKLTKLANICILDANQTLAVQTTIIPSILGNWLSHFETNSIMSLNSSTLLGFMSQIDSFYDCFKYDKDGSKCFYKSLIQK
ncbi:hypothetical protein HUW51_19380 [Adhaeribacter swui]|uniref:Uncharacterized protein n=1 Tax=Adhaeribacter swui TaxID=2086471 RepID=A0A7G7GC98_9BACT|nr:hypothetical protein [Adhaeribacter swui]QNF34782.1 hypothetical protein HUW51_19380 [Adhaeribacter swui]